MIIKCIKTSNFTDKAGPQEHSGSDKLHLLPKNREKNIQKLELKLDQG